MANRTVLGTITSSRDGTPLAGVRVEIILTDCPRRGDMTTLWSGKTNARGGYTCVVDVPAAEDAEARPGQPALHAKVSDGGHHVTFGDGKYLAECLGLDPIRLDMSAAADINTQFGFSKICHAGDAKTIYEANSQSCKCKSVDDIPLDAEKTAALRTATFYYIDPGALILSERAKQIEKLRFELDFLRELR